MMTLTADVERKVSQRRRRSAVFTCIGALVTPAERGPSLVSNYRVSLTVDLCEGYGRKLATFIALLSATIPAQHKNSPLL